MMKKYYNLWSTFIFFILIKLLPYNEIYFLTITKLTSAISLSFFKIFGSSVLFDEFLNLFFCFTNVSLVIRFLLFMFIIFLIYIQPLFFKLTFPIVLTRHQMIVIFFTTLLFLVNMNLFWVIEYLTMLSKHSGRQIVVLEYSMEGIIHYTLYSMTISCSTLFMFLTVCSNLFIILYLTVKFFYAYLAQAELLVKRLLLLLFSKRLLLLLFLPKSLDKLIRIVLSCFSFILLVCLSVSVLLTFSHTLDLFFVYKDLERISEILLSKNEYLHGFFLIEVMMVWMYVTVIEQEIHDLEEMFECFFMFYRSLFLFLAVLLPLYPPVL